MKESILETVCILCLLTACAYTDIRSRELSLKFMLGFGVVEAGLLLYRCLSDGVYIPWGILVGLGLLLISYFTRGAIGDGDAILIMLTGLLLNLKTNLMLFTGAAVMAAVYGILLLWLKRMDKKTEMPFVPFLLITYVGMIVL